VVQHAGLICSRMHAYGLTHSQHRVDAEVKAGPQQTILLRDFVRRTKFHANRPGQRTNGSLEKSRSRSSISIVGFILKLLPQGIHPLPVRHPLKPQDRNRGLRELLSGRDAHRTLRKRTKL
jgi:hypothetical protein